MIRSVVYRRTDITFPLNYDLIDGNTIFDSISVSDTLKAVIRFNYGSLWYKIYLPDLFVNADKKRENTSELDDVIVSFIERKTKSFQDISLEELLKDGKYSKILEDGIILVLSHFFNKKKVYIILDFYNKICFLDYHWPYKDQEFAIKNKIVDVINNSLNKNIDFGDKVEMRNIVVDIEFEDKFPRLDLLSDLIMNDSILRKEFKLCERYAPRSFKSKYTLRMNIIRSGNNASVYQVLLLFINHGFLLVRVTGLHDKFLVPEIKERLSFLMKMYDDSKIELASIYDKLLGYSSDDFSKSAGKKLLEIKNLRKEVPELFIPGYSRECSVKPFIVSEERAEELKKEGRKTIRYPKEGFYSRIYACPNNYHPGLKLNRLSNNSEFSYLPVCYLTDHSLNPDSNYSNYYYEETKKTQKKSSNDILLKEEYGIVPGMLKKILMKDGKEVFKIGSPKSKSSCLYCIHSYFGEVFTESTITNIRKKLNFNPSICLQELWYMDLEEIISTARNPNIFLDPTLYIRALERIYNLNIYVFDVNGKNNVRISIAECPLPYIWEPNQGKSIAILCYRGIHDFPHCEYIRLDEIQSTRLEEYKKDYLTLIEGPRLKNPSTLFPEDNYHLLSQQINSNGKCISVTARIRTKPWIPKINDDESLIHELTIAKQCFWRPLDLPIEEPSEKIIEMKKDIKNREMAYFLCDLVGILGTLIDNKNLIMDYIRISQEELSFEPFVVRERFENLDEYFSYYSARLPSVFRKSKIIVNGKIYLQLVRFISSFHYSRLFSKVIKPRHFNKEKNTIIIIRKK